MATTAAQLLVKISADGAKETKDDIKGVSDATDKAGDHTHGLLDTMAGFVGGAAIVHLAGDAFGFLKGQVTDSWNEGIQANQVLAQLAAGLKSTHDASGQTVDSLEKMATNLSDTTGISKSAVETGQAMLLTFTGLGKSVLPDATQAVADMATKMNGGAIPTAQQMNQTALQLGKALNDPATGMMMLRREGVTFTKQQQEQIKAMEKAGNVGGAQALMLQELNREFGNSATAAGQANGGLAILSAQFDNMKEALGQQLIPIMGQLLGAIQPIASGLLSGLGGAIAGITPLFNSLTSAAKGMPLRQTGQMFQLLAQVAEQVGNKVKSAALPVLKELGTFFTEHLLPAFNQLVGFAAGTLIPMFGDIATFLLTTVVPALLQLASFFTDTVLPAAEQLISWFRANVLPVLMALVKVIVTDVLPTLESLAKLILTKVIPPIERIVGIILPILIPAFQAIGWVISNIVGPALGLLLNLLGFLLDKVADLVQGIRDHLPQAIAAVGSFFSGLGTKIHDAITTFTNAGHDIIQGLINGVKGMLGGAVKAISDVGNGMLGTIKGMFGIKSPSTVFAELGANLSQGLINGVTGVDVAGPVGRHLGGLMPSLSASVGVHASGLVAPSSAALLSQQIASAGSVVGGSSGQPVILQVDGRTLAQALVPHLPGVLRHGTAVRGY